MSDTLDKWAVLDQIGWDPHSGQLAVAESTARNRVVSAGRRFGKALWVGTPILTARGWVTIGDISKGDQVFSPDGSLASVIAVTDVMEGRPCYNVEFMGAESIIADAEHLWLTSSRAERRRGVSSIKTTEQIYAMPLKVGGDSNNRIPHTEPLRATTNAKVPIPPYTLGAWLGDGGQHGQNFSCHEDDHSTIANIEKDGFQVSKHASYCGWGIKGLGRMLDDAMLIGNKHIPEVYFQSSVENRLALVQGLMDTDGWVNASGGACCFSNTNWHIAQGLSDLVVSLGGRVRMKEGRAVLDGVDHGPCWGLHINLDMDLFRMPRKLEAQYAKKRIGQSARAITGVHKVKSVPVRCIQVGRPDGMYLAGRDLIPTHNSDIGGHELVPEALFTASVANELKLAGKRREFWIVGPEYSDSEKEFRVLWNELNKLDVPFDRPGTYNDPISGNMHISLWNGAFQVHGKSAKYPTSLVGEGLSGVILAEAAKLKEKVWTKYIRPTLADFHGWSLMTSTPEGKNWFYDYWQRGQNPNETEWDSWRMPSWLNPYVYRTPTLTRDVKLMFELKKLTAFKNMTMKEIYIEHNKNVGGLGRYREPFQVDPEILSLMDDLTPEAFNQEIGADFTEFVGRVFKDFDEEVHVRPLTWNPAWETYAAVDYGFTNPNVWLLIQVGPWGEVNIMEEIYEPGLTALEFADLIIDRGLCPAGLRAFYPDPASPGDTRILEQKLRVRARSGTGGELKDRIDAIRLGLKESPLHVPRGHIDRRPKLLINQGHCPKTVHEFNEYRYPDQKNDLHLDSLDKPLKKDDHTPEALGRFWKGYFGTPQQVRSKQRVTKAKVKR